MLLVLLLAASSSADLAAQVLQTDIVAAGSGADTARFAGSVRFDLAVEQQLNTVVSFSAASEMRIAPDDELIVFGAQARRSRAGDVRISNSGFAHLRFRPGRRARAGGETFLQYQWDGPRGMETRALLGANAWISLSRDSSGSLDAAAGIMAEGERWSYEGIEPRFRPPGAAPVAVRHARLNTYLRYERRVRPGIVLLLANYVQTRLTDRFDAPRIATSARLAVELTGALSLAVSWNSIYDAAPVVPIRRFYFDLANGIAVRW